jgi:hypothetical protein
LGFSKAFGENCMRRNCLSYKKLAIFSTGKRKKRGSRGKFRVPRKNEEPRSKLEASLLAGIFVG